MEKKYVTLPGFTVIGKETSSESGPDFVERAWAEANSLFPEVAAIAKTDKNGAPVIWGLMSDLSRSFRPWEDGFTKGLYLAGIETAPDAAVPEGWKKWESPAYEYYVVPADGPDAFTRALEELESAGMSLAGAAYDRIVPGTGTFFWLPVRRIT